MDAKLEEYKARWEESTRVGLEGDAALGREKYARDVIKKPIPDESTALYKQRNALRAECVTLAQEWVDANKQMCEARFGGVSRENLVADVSHFRRNERFDEQWAAEAWLLATFEPQRIGGTGNIEVKRAGR